MENQLLSQSLIPKWFAYPEAALSLVELGLLNLKPWKILTGDQLIGNYDSLKKLNYVPFAIRLDNDDMVCWSLKHDKKLVQIDNLALGFGPDKVYESVWDWFNEAVQDLIEFHT